MVCATLAGAGADGGAKHATALFGGTSGVEGHVRFTQGAAGGPTVVQTALTGLANGPNPWHIHTGCARCCYAIRLVSCVLS